LHTPGLVDGALQDAGLIVLPIGPHAILGSVAPERRGELRGGGAVDRDKGAGKPAEPLKIWRRLSFMIVRCLKTTGLSE